MLCQICGQKMVSATCTICGMQVCDDCSFGPLCKHCASRRGLPDISGMKKTG